MSCCTNYETGIVKVSDYYSDVQPTWCGGCGNFMIWAALKRALAELELSPDKVVLAFDIGCNGNGNDKIRGYRVHSLHGRVLPLAQAIKIANPDLTVIAMAGDGATYSEGIGHIVNSFRNNYPLTFLVHDNGNYALTTGQASATTPQGAPRTANPDGPTASTLNPVDLALALQPSFVARAFSGEIKHLTEVIKAAILHQRHGFGFVDILQSCPTYNKETTQDWYYSRIKDISSYEGYNPADLEAARRVAQIGDEVAIGVLYENSQVPNYLGRLAYRHGEPWKNSQPVSEVKKYDVDNFLNRFK